MADVEKVAREWPPLKKALWDVVTGEELNTKYVNAWDLTDKLYEAALAAMGERGAAPHPDEPRPKHLCQMIRDGLAAGACLAIAEPDEDGFLARSLILPADEVEEMLRLAEGTGVTQALADLRRQLHHTQAELMLATSPRPEAAEEAVKALEFYADKDRWEEYRDDIRASIYDRDTGSVFGRDTGETARMALAKLKVEQR